MKTVLILSSQVATSRVGGTAAQFCLQRLGLRTVLLPTTLLGRHPGWGAPGGGAVATDKLRSIWDGIAAQGLSFDAVLTGYFADTEQIDFAAEVISQIKQVHPDIPILIDPVMGDEAHGSAKGDKTSGLYISEPRALKIIHDLVVPHASIATPNLWEMEYMRGQLAGALAARPAKTLIVTSMRGQDQTIGSDLSIRDEHHVIRHAYLRGVPHGCGDTLAALYLGHNVLGASAEQAHDRAVSSLFAIIQQTVQSDERELALESAQDYIINAPALTSP